MTRPGRLQKTLVILAHAGAGWAYCGALIGIGRKLMPLPAALVAHAVGAPIGFALLSWLYFRRFAYTGPLQTAAAFLAVVIGLDLFLVAPVFENSYAMFASPLGTWIPLALIFAATLFTGRCCSEARVTWAARSQSLRPSRAGGDDSAAGAARDLAARPVDLISAPGSAPQTGGPR